MGSKFWLCLLSIRIGNWPGRSPAQVRMIKTKRALEPAGQNGKEVLCLPSFGAGDCLPAQAPEAEGALPMDAPPGDVQAHGERTRRNLGGMFDFVAFCGD